MCLRGRRPSASPRPPGSGGDTPARPPGSRASVEVTRTLSLGLCCQHALPTPATGRVSRFLGVWRPHSVLVTGRDPWGTPSGPALPIHPAGHCLTLQLSVSPLLHGGFCLAIVCQHGHLESPWPRNCHPVCSPFQQALPASTDASLCPCRPPSFPLSTP